MKSVKRSMDSRALQNETYWHNAPDCIDLTVGKTYTTRTDNEISLWDVKRMEKLKKKDSIEGSAAGATVDQGSTC